MYKKSYLGDKESKRLIVPEDEFDSLVTSINGLKRTISEAIVIADQVNCDRDSDDILEEVFQKLRQGWKEF